mmetsp:Transcript_30008/g.58891  ORF Transcript_30008/g.58891 Transcript_30008/m.58891 type:complete len:329 (+) Transcript_30008:1199-2185(+)
MRCPENAHVAESGGLCCSPPRLRGRRRIDQRRLLTRLLNLSPTGPARKRTPLHDLRLANWASTLTPPLFPRVNRWDRIIARGVLKQQRPCHLHQCKDESQLLKKRRHTLEDVWIVKVPLMGRPLKGSVCSGVVVGIHQLRLDPGKNRCSEAERGNQDARHETFAVRHPTKPAHQRTRVGKSHPDSHDQTVRHQQSRKAHARPLGNVYTQRHRHPSYQRCPARSNVAFQQSTERHRKSHANHSAGVDPTCILVARGRSKAPHVTDEVGCQVSVTIHSPQRCVQDHPSENGDPLSPLGDRIESPFCCLHRGRNPEKKMRGKETGTASPEK